MRNILSILLLSVCYSQDCGEGYIWNNETIIYGGLPGCHFSKNSKDLYILNINTLQRLSSIEVSSCYIRVFVALFISMCVHTTSNLREFSKCLIRYVNLIWFADK